MSRGAGGVGTARGGRGLRVCGSPQGWLMLEIPGGLGHGAPLNISVRSSCQAPMRTGPLSSVSEEAAWSAPSRVNTVLVFRVSTLKTEFLPLLSVRFVSENSVVAAVSISLAPGPVLTLQNGSRACPVAVRTSLGQQPCRGSSSRGSRGGAALLGRSLGAHPAGPD